MASFIMAGRLQAIAFTLFFAVLSLFLPPLGLYSSAAVGLVALRQGTQQGTIIALIASVMMAVLTLLMQQGFALGLVSGLQSWLPMVIFAAILTRTISWAFTLQVMVLIVVGGLLIFHLAVSDVEAFWKEYIDAIVKAFTQGQTISAEEISQLTVDIARWITTVIAVLILISWIVSMIIARYWQAILYNPGGFGEEFRALQLGKPFAAVAIVMAAAYSFSQSELITGIALVVLSAFLFQGLALIHYLVNKLQMNQFWLVGMYILMLLFPSNVIVLVIITTLGVMDNFANFRDRLTTNSN